MINLPIQNINALRITVTNTATPLFELMNVAGGINDSSNYYTKLSANAVILSSDSGGIRWLVNGSPTSTIGTLLSEGGSAVITNADLTELNLISTGASSVVNVQIFKSYPSDGIKLTAPAGGSSTIQLFSGTADVNFGLSSQESSNATVTVSDTHVKSNSIILLTPSGQATADHDPDDYGWDNISAYVSNIVAGVGFDVVGVAPNGSFGTYKINYLFS